MCLNGRDDVELVSLAINGSPLPESAYTRTPKTLTITAPPSGDFELTTVTHIKPQENTSLEGLYKSGGNFSSQVLTAVLATVVTHTLHWLQKLSVEHVLGFN